MGCNPTGGPPAGRSWEESGPERNVPLANDGQQGPKADVGEAGSGPAVAPVQIAKSEYSGFTGSSGGNNMPAATVALVPCSTSTKEPVRRFVS